MKNIILILVLVFSSLYAFSQEDAKEHYIGVNMGFTTGHGFAYKFSDTKFAIQATVLPIKYKDTYYISGGLTAFYYLKRSKYYRTFLFLGNHFITTDTDDEHNVGFGSGFSVGKDVMFNLMLGYGAFDVYNTFNLLPTVEIGVSYKLKTK